VYLDVSRYRRQMNGVPLCEPLDWTHIDPCSCEAAKACAKPAKTEASAAQPPAK
jgi:hypothetical protein